MTTTKTVQELAAEMSAQFETKKRNDDKTFVSLKDGRPDWMQDVCREAHGDMLPDDWRYSFISEAVDYIAENGCGEDRAAEFADDVNVYTSELTDWLGSHSERLFYCDRAAEEFGDGDSTIDTAMRRGQYMEREEVFQLVVSALEKIADEG